jgi:dGTPase
MNRDYNNILPRERVERYEEKILAPYAAKSSNSRGRKFPQKEHPVRTAFQRDRDRIIHSAAFRRLEYKTQVFVNHEGDHYRTRLTHTIEVAQISRSVARALGLNEDLAEAIALVHDLGHTPFGHSGEDVLNELMADYGGFGHNRQTLKVVDYLERRYPHHPGLNLTYEVREGIVKHETSHEPINPNEFPPDEHPTLEAALVDVADGIAYSSHDIDDGLTSGILNWDDLGKVEIWAEALAASEEHYPGLDAELRRHDVVRSIVNALATDLVDNTAENLGKANIQTLADVRMTSVKMAVFSPEMKAKTRQLKQFLGEKLYRHEHMLRMAGQARMIITALFNYYKNDPEKLHDKYRLRLGTEPTEIIISDFIAGMTDRYAYKMYDTIK